MYMNEGLDTGDVLLARPLRIGRRETSAHCMTALLLLRPRPSPMP
jgi:methionyl-tRNA formyltransferase